VTAGAGNDSLTDVPTPWFANNTTGDVGGVFRGNYATWNPLLDWKTNGSAFTLSNGNLDVSEPSATTWGSVASTISMPSGKWYCEITATTVGAAQYTYIGITATTSAAGFPGQTATSYSYRANGNKLNNDATGAGVAYGASYAANDIIGIAFDADAGSLTFYKNGTSQGTAYTGISAESYYFVVGDYATSQSSAFTANFGQRPFAYTPPTGFRSLCTTNLPATAIGFGLTNQGKNYFDATTYTGTGSSNPIVNAGSFAPDLLWVKDRSRTANNILVDSVRGVNNLIRSESTAAEVAGSFISSLNSNGFTLAANTLSDAYYTNVSGDSFVGWNWKASGSTVTNTAGTVTSTVSANTTAGFSIVTFTGTGANATVGHGLGVAPSMYIVKRRSNTGNWYVYHISIGNTNRLRLDETSASTAESAAWNNTSPTSTVFSIGTSVDVNASTNTYVAYCFAQVAGYSAMGSYTGNGSTDGTFIFTGFRPRFVMFKRTDAVEQWAIRDTARDTYNASELELFPNLSNAEEDNNLGIDLISNGFKIRNSANRYNASSGTYIYMAFAEVPTKFSLAR